MSGGARRSGRKEGARRSICPVSCTLDLIGDRWTLLVVRDLLAGKSHFQEFLRSPEQAVEILSRAASGPDPP